MKCYYFIKPVDSGYLVFVGYTNQTHSIEFAMKPMNEKGVKNEVC